MSHRVANGLGRMLAGAVLGAITVAAQGATNRAVDREVEDLLYDEALYAAGKQDHLAAISRLLNSLGDDSSARLPPSQSLSLARLAVEYGLYDQARTVLQPIPPAQVPSEDLNRAWYELARVDFNRGNAAAARGSLNSMNRRLSRELDAERRLLLGQVLLALGDNVQAAQVLEDWRGPPVQTGYASYNRGIALLRAGQTREGVKALEQVNRMRGDGEEMLALKDKSNLALGYALAQRNDLDRARNYLERVRLQGPFSNAALLAKGWLELEQGRPKAALGPWLALRERAASDPAVQEALLTAPSVQRELEQLPGAARDLETAVDTYTRQLEQLSEASATLQSREGLRALLEESQAAKKQASEIASTRPTTSGGQYLGEVMAGGSYQSVLRDYGDLAFVEDRLKDWLGDVDQLDQVVEEQMPPAPGARPRADSNRGDGPRVSLKPGRRSGPEGRSGRDSGNNLPERPVPTLRMPQSPALEEPGKRSRRDYGELELPPEGLVAPFPEPEIIGLPDSEFIGLPESDASGLPPEPEFIDAALGEASSLPDAPEWRDLGDRFAWLPYPPFEFSRPAQVGVAPPTAPLLEDRPSAPGRAAASVHSAAGMGSLEQAILGAARRTDALQRALDSLGDDRSDLWARLAALRERIAALGPWIERTKALHEQYVRGLALAELESRRQRLEGYLERARLELARTYDLAAEE